MEMETRPYHPDRERRAEDNLGSKWFRRFSYVALANAAIAVVWSIPILIPQFQISRQIAGGSAGTWGFVGYSLFLTIGFASMMAWGVLYFIIPNVLNKRIFSNKLAALHLILSEVGLIFATGLLSIAGYLGGTMLLAERSFPEIHEALIVYVEPIGYFTMVLMAGIILGIVNLGLSMSRIGGRKGE